jgi:hypothetical protein
MPAASVTGVQPLAFEPSGGQSEPQVQFRARGQGYTVFLTPDGAQLTLGSPVASVVVRMSFVNAAPPTHIAGLDQLAGTMRQFPTGGDSCQSPGIVSYKRVRYGGIYPGVDVVYRGEDGPLEYDFIVAPGADPGGIGLAFEGMQRMELDASGALVLHTPAGSLRQPRPIIYQELAGVRQQVPGAFVRRGSSAVGFRLGPYDASVPLVIDPVLVYSGYLGGSYDEGAESIAVDGEGNAYITGTTVSPDFPVTTGTNATPQGGQDAYVAKFSPTGALLYCTLVGGPCEDTGNAIAVDAAGNAYIAGRAALCYAEGLPPGVLVAKLSPTGALIYLYTFGGSLADTSAGYAITVDADGNAYVAGKAQASTSDFPVTSGAFQTNRCGGLADGFVAKVNPAGNGLVYCTYLCGSDFDVPLAIGIDSARNAYVAGKTASHDFPTLNAYQPVHPGGPVADAGFVSKLSPDGSSLLYSTYFGGSFADAVVTALAVDAGGNVYVTGETTGGDFPTTRGVVQPTSPFPLCLGELCSDAFVAKFGPAGSLLYSTYLAGEGHEGGAGIAVDAEGNAYVAGSTASLYFPIRNSFQAANRGLSDVFLTKLNADASRILFSSFLGGGKPTNSPSLTEGTDEPGGLALGPGPGVYTAGYSSSLNFPTTPGAFQTNAMDGDCFFSLATCGDAFVTRITADGPGIVPPIHLGVSPTEILPGGIVNVAWGGIPQPSTNDLLELFALGERSDIGSVLAAYATGGAANGMLPLPLPPALTSRAYEFRLLTVDPAYPPLLKSVARSEPVNVVVPIISVSLERPANVLHLHIRALLPGTYHVQATDTLAPPADWQVIGTLNVTNVNSAEFTQTISTTSPSRFYRISL